MCGRIAQSRAVAAYLEAIAWNLYRLSDGLGPRYYTPPVTHPLESHRQGGGIMLAIHIIATVDGGKCDRIVADR